MNIRNFIYIIIFFILFSCSTAQNDKSTPVIIKDISITQSDNRSPKESDFQTDIELLAIMHEDNLSQEITYHWDIEVVPIDLQNSILQLNKQDDDNSEDLVELKKTLPFFLDISNNPLNALLTVYKSGYYKITLKASNSDSFQEKSIIIKVGEPELPHLMVKLNIPQLPEKTAYMGKLHLELIEGENTHRFTVSGEEIKDQWYSLEMPVNPFKFFILKSGTHLVNIEKNILLNSINKDFVEIEKDSIQYQIGNDVPSTLISNKPIVIKKPDNKIQFNKIGDFKWQNDDIFISLLNWYSNEEGKNNFKHEIKIINNDSEKITLLLDHNYLSKIFIGSIGHKVKYNNYFIFFGPEGVLTEELDPKNSRPYTSLPYGYLLGKLGEEGKTFSIGNEYTNQYNTNNIIFYRKDTQSDQYISYQE